MTAPPFDSMTASLPIASQEELQRLFDLHTQACFFTGHRTIPQTDIVLLHDALNDQLDALIYQGFTVFFCGAARGFDLMAASAVICKKKKHPELRLILLLPCRNQTRGWQSCDRALYELVLARGEVYLLAEHYRREGMLFRNRMLVDHAIFGLTYYNEANKSSGTGMTVRYAEEQKKPMINLYEMLHPEDGAAAVLF